MTEPDAPPPAATPPAAAQRGGWVAAAVLIVALAVRLIAAFTRPVDEASLAALPDQVEYLHTAQSFLQGRGFCFYDAGFNDTVYAYRMPGYPMLIAMCGAKVRVVQIVQSLFDVSSALAVFLMTKRLLSLSAWERSGEGTKRRHAMSVVIGAQSPHLTSPTGRETVLAPFVALLFVAFNPFLIYFSTLLLSETLFTALLIWGMFCLTSRRRTIAAAGLLALIGSIYVRPGAVALPVLLAIAAMLVRPNALAGRSFFRVPAGAAALVMTIAALLPWAIRNHAQLGVWVWLTTNDGITLYDGFNPLADGSSNQSHFRNWTELKTIGETGRSRYLCAMANSMWPSTRAGPSVLRLPRRAAFGRQCRYRTNTASDARSCWLQAFFRRRCSCLLRLACGLGR